MELLLLNVSRIVLEECKVLILVHLDALVAEGFLNERIPQNHYKQRTGMQGPHKK